MHNQSFCTINPLENTMWDIHIPEPRHDPKLKPGNQIQEESVYS